MRVIQFQDDSGQRRVGLVEADGDHAIALRDFSTIYELANAALDRGVGLAALVSEAA